MFFAGLLEKTCWLSGMPWSAFLHRFRGQACLSLPWCVPPNPCGERQSARQCTCAGVRNRYYFATLTRQEGPAVTPPQTAGLDSVPFEELEVGPVLGKGGFGRVYRGLWHGKQVAVKVLPFK